MLNAILFLLVLFAIVVICYAIEYWYAKKDARKILDDQQALYSGKMQYIEVLPQSFPWLDHSFYDETAKNMQNAGFRHVGNFECITATIQYPSMKTFMMCFTGNNATISAAVYHIKIRGLMGLLASLNLLQNNIRAIEFETEFKDGTFLNINNCNGLNPFTDYPNVITIQLEPDTPFEQILAQHCEVLKIIINDYDIQPIHIASKQELLASQDRLHKLKSEYRINTGYITHDQLEEMAGGEFNHYQRKIASEFAKMQDLSK